MMINLSGLCQAPSPHPQDEDTALLTDCGEGVKRWPHLDRQERLRRNGIQRDCLVWLLDEPRRYGKGSSPP